MLLTCHGLLSSRFEMCSFFFSEQVQERFEVDIKELPEQIDTATYSMSSPSLTFHHCAILYVVELVKCRELFPFAILRCLMNQYISGGRLFSYCWVKFPLTREVISDHWLIWCQPLKQILLKFVTLTSCLIQVSENSDFVHSASYYTS